MNDITTPAAVAVDEHGCAYVACPACGYVQLAAPTCCECGAGMLRAGMVEVEDVLIAAIREHGNASVRWILDVVDGLHGGTHLWNAWGDELTALMERGECEMPGAATVTGNPVIVTMPGTAPAGAVAAAVDAVTDAATAMYDAARAGDVTTVLECVDELRGAVAAVERAAGV